MSPKAPTEHKTVQSRILAYAEDIGWRYVPRAEAERRRRFDPEGATPEERARPASLYFGDVLHAQVLAFNPKYPSAEGALIGEFQRLTADIAGNRDFLLFLRNQGKFYCAEEKRELDLQLVDYRDLDRPQGEWRNVYEVTEEFYVHNGRYGTREDVVFLVNGMPVLVVECKNATKDEAIALGVDQLRRYHEETPEVMVPEMLFTATEAIGFAYGVTWNTVRRNIFRWKSEEIGNLEAKVKSFCAVPHLLRFLRDFILFAEKEEELQKFILRQHQTVAVDKVVARALDGRRSRGLVWHTQGSGKTYTMIKAAEMLFKANAAQKPTVLLMIDRNELEDQMLKNLASLGLGNVAHADRIGTLNRLLDEKGQDYRGIVVTMIHKFRDMPANLNTRKNIFVLIDEAHRTTGGDLGNFLMAGLPNASFIGFTGTPVDKTAYGRGTFKTFGCEDDQGYLHKYSIAESIEDGTTLPLYYNLAPNEMRVPHEIMEKEFLALAETEGIADIEELNRILERAVNLKNFLKGKDRVPKVARFVAGHFRENVEPLGYKAFLVAVDREACVFYKEALDRILPPEYSEIIFTGNNNDAAHLKRWHLDDKKEKQIRKNFTRPGEWPKILIVTEKLLTGFDAPILYALYLDKPMRDHTLLQAIARVNRPYENEAAEMVKPHGFVLDFVGIFDKLEKALAFDSDEVNAIVKDLGLLKQLFKAKMETKAPEYLALIGRKFDDKDVDNLIEHFRDKERRKEFFKEYKEIEMLYEIISPDAFLRPFMDDYTTLSAIYAVVRNAYARKVYVDKAFQKKTNALVREHIGALMVAEPPGDYLAIDKSTIDAIKQREDGNATKVINLVKSIEKTAEENSDDPFLVALSERARAVQESFENRQTTTAEALAELLQAIERNERRKQEQAVKGVDALTYFVLCKLTDDGIPNPETASRKVAEAFVKYPNWRRSEAELREVRKQATFALFAEEDDMEKVTATVDALFTLLQKSFRR
ncbi:HsdR family type I site-specific deoxyribonuclease [Methylocaldum sp.]|uniref:type I restriction endonuclease subunit R n=1 Tax=Methylocaldum sp. TaxID=1969727 RepID=UPI002D731B33|nr:HsdR family type I site-specific deoxyribonuclease [Methylocaldum sp.]HYE36307.1 HsdR family type I site-specific deoxyribonuclease [Methylocaldum sp.]